MSKLSINRPIYESELAMIAYVTSSMPSTNLTRSQGYIFLLWGTLHDALSVKTIYLLVLRSSCQIIPHKTRHLRWLLFSYHRRYSTLSGLAQAASIQMCQAYYLPRLPDVAVGWGGCSWLKSLIRYRKRTKFCHTLMEIGLDGSHSKPVHDGYINQWHGESLLQSDLIWRVTNAKEGKEQL